MAKGLHGGKKLEEKILQVELYLFIKVGTELRQLKEEELEKIRLMIIMRSFEPLLRFTASSKPD